MEHPIKPTIKSELFPLILLGISLGLAYYFYAKFPEIVPVHWNYKGEPDNYASRWMGAIMMPIVVFLVYILFLLIPYLDPKKDRYIQFRKPYRIFKDVLILFLTIIFAVSGFNILGYDISVGFWVPFLVGILFIVLGNYMPKIKNNWFMGIRTPWTLSSEEVWNKTHRLGGKLFILGGIILIVLNYLPFSFRMPIFYFMIITVVLVPMIYSYMVYLKEQKDKTNDGNKQS